MSPIRRKPVPTEQPDSTKKQANVDSKISDTQEISAASSHQNEAHELAGDSGDRPPGQIQSVELISDDESALESSFDSPPLSELPPQDIDINQEGFHARATAAYDGRVDIKINSSARRLSRLFAPAIQSQVDHANDDLPVYTPIPDDFIGSPTPALNVLIQIVGSRGDVHPFVSLGLVLKKFGHRVRLATHPTFQTFVEEHGLEFFSIGGDPAGLMAFMVKNPSLLPSLDKAGRNETFKRRKEMREILHGCWRSCIQAGNGIPDAQVPGGDSQTGGDPKPFVADVIIANPPTFAHLHCAEKLGIPLHLMFTMPWSSTQAFAHPLANIQSSNEDEKMTNYLSYFLVDMLTWQGLGDIINRFRRKVLGLDPVDPLWAPGMIARMQVPFTYCWSPALIPKPRDWNQNINVAGFYFLPFKSSYTPSPDLAAFLQAGPLPIYIGFGSIVVDNPAALTEKIFEAVQLTGVRALLSKGWGDLGGSKSSVPPNIFMLGDCPHDWLFERVACVVHHGGAGTTAAGVAAGKPTVIVPFFGDQPFWGNMIARAGAGPRPTPYKILTATNLAAAISAALQPAMVEGAKLLGAKIRGEQGSEVGMKIFHDRLPLAVMGCSIVPHRVAVWKVRKTKIKLSAVAATVLRKEGLLDFRTLKLFRPCEYNLNHGPWDPVSGGTMAVGELFYDVFKGLGEIGSEFVRVPNVGQNKGVLPNDSEQVYYPARPQKPSENDKILGARAAKGLTRLTTATLRSPMTFTVALAQGAHNAPKMWGDKTVRPQEKITGLGSGLKAAGKEFALQTYDGVSGLLTQPIIGAQEEGSIGMVKGIGKGLLGSVAKSCAAMSGLVGYPLKGIDAQITKSAKMKIFDPIVSARMAQGESQYPRVSEEEKKDIIERWLVKCTENEVKRTTQARKEASRQGGERSTFY